MILTQYKEEQHYNLFAGFFFQINYIADRPDVTVSPDKTPYNVNENTTNVNFTCNVKSANPDVMFYRWFKDGIEIFIGDTYIIPNVLKSNAGKYECDATNIVGVSDHSSALQLNVLCEYIIHYTTSIFQRQYKEFIL